MKIENDTKERVNKLENVHMRNLNYSDNGGLFLT